MALRSPTSTHSFWGALATIDLPTTDPNVQIGDTAFDTTLGQFLVCTATGPVVWTPVGGGGGGGGVRADNVIWVEEAGNGGNDATAARGDSYKPFATLNAALAAAINGDLILLGTGTFVGPGPVSDANPGLTDITIIGKGQNNTTIQSYGPLGASCFRFAFNADGLAWQRFVLRGVTLAQLGGINAIVLDGGAAGAAAYFPEPSDGTNRTGFYLYDVDIILSGNFNDAAYVGMATLGLGRCERVTCSTNYNIGISSFNAKTTILRDCSLSGLAVTHAFSFAGAPNPATTQPAALERCTARQIFVVEADARATLHDCSIAKILGAGFDPTSTYALDLSVFGGNVEEVDFDTNAFPDTAVALSVSFFNTTIGQSSFRVDGAPPANRQPVLLSGCDITGTVTAGKGVDLDARSSSFQDGVVGSAITPDALPDGGTILPPSFAAPSDNNGNPVTNLSFGFNLPSSNYTFLVEGDDVTAGPWAVTSKSATGVTITAAGNGGKVGGTVFTG